MHQSKDQLLFKVCYCHLKNKIKSEMPCYVGYPFNPVKTPPLCYTHVFRLPKVKVSHNYTSNCKVKRKCPGVRCISQDVL